MTRVTIRTSEGEGRGGGGGGERENLFNTRVCNDLIPTPLSRLKGDILGATPLFFPLVALARAPRDANVTAVTRRVGRASFTPLRQLREKEKDDRRMTMRGNCQGEREKWSAQTRTKRSGCFAS